MSDTTADVTEAPAEETDASTAEQEQADTSQESDAAEATQDDDEPSDWRKNFDPDKAAARIAKIQSENKNLRERTKAAEQKAAESEQVTKEKVPALEQENRVLRVALDLGLPPELADRLKGSTREELLQDAQALLQLVSTPKPTVRKPVEALRGGGQPDKEPEETDTRKIAERMFRK